jgi:hypothetical protein
MIETIRDRRKRQAGWALLAAALSIAVAFITLAISRSANNPAATVGPAAADFVSRGEATQKITITSADGTFTIVRNPNGTWVMPERGNYPVSPAKLSSFARAMADLQLTAQLTADPRKHGRLQVVDPREGGNGVLVQAEDPQGARLIDLIVGAGAAGFAVRRPSDPQVWATNARPADFPLLARPADWLDLVLLPNLAQEHPLARVTITPPAGGPAFMIERPAADSDAYVLAPPFSQRAVASPSALPRTAQALGTITPIDIAQAPAIPGPPVGRVQAVSVDGLVFDGELFTVDGRRWLKLVARAERPEAQAQADAITQRVAPWAYALSPTDEALLAPSLDQLSPPPTPLP